MEGWGALCRKDRKQPPEAPAYLSGGCGQHRAASLRGPPPWVYPICLSCRRVPCALFVANEEGGFLWETGLMHREPHTEKAVVAITLAGADGRVPASCLDVLRGLELQQPPGDPGVTHVRMGCQQPWTETSDLPPSRSLVKEQISYSLSPVGWGFVYLTYSSYYVPDIVLKTL